MRGGAWVRGPMRSFPLQPAWWLQAVDFHTLPHLFTLHLVIEKCAKTPPTSRHESGVGGVLTSERTKEEPGARKEASG